MTVSGDASFAVSDDAYPGVRAEREPSKIAEPEIAAEQESPRFHRASEDDCIIGAAQTNVSDVVGFETESSQRLSKRTRKILVNEEPEHSAVRSLARPRLLRVWRHTQEPPGRPRGSIHIPP